LLIGVGISNRRPDHRLRLHVELAEPATRSAALSPFEIVERPLASEGGTETPSPTWPARGAVSAGGVTVLHPGVFEYEVLLDPPELAVTLLRCVGTISRPQLATRAWAAGPDIATPDAQMIGEQSFDLAVASRLQPVDMPGLWERVYLPAPMAEAPGGGRLADSGSLLEVEGAELSAVRKVDGRVQVRIWNPALEARIARVAKKEVRLGPAQIIDVEI
jgi:alpha-mannosidase